MKLINLVRIQSYRKHRTAGFPRFMLCGPKVGWTVSTVRKFVGALSREHYFLTAVHFSKGTETRDDGLHQTLSE